MATEDKKRLNKRVSYEGGLVAGINIPNINNNAQYRTLASGFADLENRLDKITKFSNQQLTLSTIRKGEEDVAKNPVTFKNFNLAKTQEEKQNLLGGKGNSVYERTVQENQRKYLVLEMQAQGINLIAKEKANSVDKYGRPIISTEEYKENLTAISEGLYNSVLEIDPNAALLVRSSLNETINSHSNAYLDKTIKEYAAINEAKRTMTISNYRDLAFSNLEDSLSNGSIGELQQQLDENGKPIIKINDKEIPEYVYEFVDVQDEWEANTTAAIKYAIANGATSKEIEDIKKDFDDNFQLILQNQIFVYLNSKDNTSEKIEAARLGRKFMNIPYTGNAKGYKTTNNEGKEVFIPYKKGEEALHFSTYNSTDKKSLSQSFTTTIATAYTDEDRKDDDAKKAADFIVTTDYGILDNLFQDDKTNYNSTDNFRLIELTEEFLPEKVTTDKNGIKSANLNLSEKATLADKYAQDVRSSHPNQSDLITLVNTLDSKADKEVEDATNEADLKVRTDNAVALKISLFTSNDVTYTTIRDANISFEDKKTLIGLLNTKKNNEKNNSIAKMEELLALEFGVIIKADGSYISKSDIYDYKINYTKVMSDFTTYLYDNPDKKNDELKEWFNNDFRKNNTGANAIINDFNNQTKKTSLAIDGILNKTRYSEEDYSKDELLDNSKLLGSFIDILNEDKNNVRIEVDDKADEKTILVLQNYHNILIETRNEGISNVN